MTEDRASAEQTAELRGQVLVCRRLLRQSLAPLSDLARHLQPSLRRAALEISAAHIGSAAKLLDALDGVLDPTLRETGYDLAVLHLQQRVARDRPHRVRTADTTGRRGELRAQVRRR